MSSVGDAKTGNRTESSTTAAHQRINLLYEILQVLSAVHVCSHFSGHGYNHRMEETLGNTGQFHIVLTAVSDLYKLYMYKIYMIVPLADPCYRKEFA